LKGSKDSGDPWMLKSYRTLLQLHLPSLFAKWGGRGGGGGGEKDKKYKYSERQQSYKFST